MFTERFSRSASATLAALLLLTGSRWMRAQTPSPSPSPKAIAKPVAEPKVAFVRFWNMLPDHSKDALELFLAKDRALTTAGASNDSASYVPVLPGTYKLSVRRVGEKKPAATTTAVHLANRGFCTILASRKDGTISLEAIDDTIDPAKEDGSARLVVRQYYPDVQASVTVGANAAATLDYNDVMTFSHLPAGEVPVAIRVTLPDGTDKTISTTVDLTKAHHGELICVSDGDARFRPFFAVDGQTDFKVPPQPPPLQHQKSGHHAKIAYAAGN